MFLHPAVRIEEATLKRGLTILTREGGLPMTDQVIRRETKAYGESLGVQVVPHGLRKNAIMCLLEASCSIAETAAFTGQTYAIDDEYAAQIDQRRIGRAAFVKLETRRSRENRMEKRHAKPQKSAG